MSLDASLKSLNQLQVKIARDYRLLTLIRDHLLEKGITDDHPYWFKKKYLYMISPTVDGSRRRIYIGADRSRQRNALLPYYRAMTISKCETKIRAITQFQDDIGLEIKKLHKDQLHKAAVNRLFTISEALAQSSIANDAIDL